MSTCHSHFSAAAILFAAFATGCASSRVEPVALWRPDDEAWRHAALTGIRLNDPKTASAGFINAERARNLYEAKTSMQAMSGVHAELAIVGTAKPNAFAFERDGRQYIAVSVSFVDALGDDRDALATTLGHELAHVKLGHRATRQERAQTAQGASQVLGVVLSAVGVPLGGTIANAGVTAVATVYSRDEERAADELGLKWALAAGYDACGAYRTIQSLQRASGGETQLSFFSTHPGYAERSAYANDLSIHATGHGCSDQR